RYRNVTDQIDRLSTASTGDRSVAVAAYGGMARVHLLVGAYAPAEEAAREMAAQADAPAERAEADRLLAPVRVHTGATAEAEGLLQGAATALAGGAGGSSDAARVLADLTELLSRSDRLDETTNSLQRSRALAPPNDHRLAIRLDTLDGKLA